MVWDEVGRREFGLRGVRGLFGEYRIMIRVVTGFYRCFRGFFSCLVEVLRRKRG